MNDKTTTAESAASPSGQATTTGDGFDTPELSTHSDPWAIEAAALPNKDVHVQVTDPLFDKQSALAVIQAPEKEGDKGLAVKFSFKLEEEIVSEEGIKKVPGSVWKPRFSSVLVGAGTEQKDQDQADRGRRDVARLLQALKIVPKGSVELGVLVAAIGKLEGRKVRLNFTVTKGSQRDASGQFKKFQNVRFASPESAGNGTGQEAAKANDDY